MECGIFYFPGLDCFSDFYDSRFVFGEVIRLFVDAGSQRFRMPGEEEVLVLDEYRPAGPGVPGIYTYKGEPVTKAMCRDMIKKRNGFTPPRLEECREEG